MERPRNAALYRNVPTTRLATREDAIARYRVQLFRQ